ncbi:MFS transporter [Acidithiobacillus sp. IBUN Pt1247-S3]|uniref:MFS transporter n=1 Tax=Acidithiobacillus sp. IBUN Pt1247-S3 TaxID=3166642 RepID=UPI0034E55D14
MSAVPPAATAQYPRGIAQNSQQFVLQTVQVFFVGLIIGMERNVLPTMRQDFGLGSHAFFFLASFVISFGLVKGALNFVAGDLSDRVGRKHVLFWGWLAGIPIPLLIFFAPNWWWIIAANVFLGINQAFTWTMTVTSQIDLAGTRQRGLAVGINEAMGYIAVGLAGLVTGYLALAVGPRWALLGFALLVVALALLLLPWVRDTLPWAQTESREQSPQNPTASDTVKTPQESRWQSFVRVSFRDRTYRALCQGGVANKVADTLVWVMLPVYFRFHGQGVVHIGWITGIYAMVWGLCQFWTGHLADRVGRKAPILSGFFLLTLGLVGVALVHHFAAWILAAAVMGIGMALLYPNLIAAMADVAPAAARGKTLGIYRYWRDTGYAIGGLLLGGAAQWTDAALPTIWLTAGIVAISGVWIAIAVRETHAPTQQ